MKINRRQFLKSIGSVSATIPFLKINAKDIFLKNSKRRILVIVELLGGNDGLNTVIPFNNKTYYNARPVVGLNKNEVLQISDEFAFHPKLTKFENLYEEDKLAIVLGTGYPDYNLSHFRSTDIWRGASLEPVINTGWIGRYIDFKYSDFENNPKNFPLFIEVKNFSTILGEGSNYSYGFTLENPENLFETMNSLYQAYRTEPKNNYGGSELTFVRDLQDSASFYSELLYNSYISVSNTVTYPQNNQLGNDLSTVARMIGSGLETPIYSVSMGGFDTHVDQNKNHPNLLENMSEAIYSFQKDLEGLQVDDEVTIFIMSEFGRRVYDNGTGTDHGTASVSFLVGNQIRGGIFGSQPSLEDLDEYGNMSYSTDFRSIYSSILNQWLSIPYNLTNSILYENFGVLPLFKTSKPYLEIIK